jgi:hypothetical protein
MEEANMNDAGARRQRRRWAWRGIANALAAAALLAACGGSKDSSDDAPPVSPPPA